MDKEDKQIIDRAIKENWRTGDRTRLKRLLEKNLKLYRENAELKLELTVEKDLHQEETNLHLHAEDYIKSLEEENNKLLDVINNQDVKIADLEKENAELKMKIYGGGYEMIITKKDADIILLEKQLKEQKEHHKIVCEQLTYTHRNIREQAKKIILMLYNAGRDVLMCRNEEKAYDNLSNAINDKSIEQFLKDGK